MKYDLFPREEYQAALNRIACNLHWEKIRIELAIKRTFIDAGLMRDPLAHIKPWHEKQT